jgi:hypothetical protein
VDANIFMLTIQIEKKQLLDTILQMPQRELEQFVAKAFLRASSSFAWTRKARAPIASAPARARRRASRNRTLP